MPSAADSRRSSPLDLLRALGLLLAPLAWLVFAGLAAPVAAAEQPGFIADHSAPAPAANASNNEYGRFLVLRPADYSRFEISPDGHVVVYFPLGVEGWYMGYHLKAGQLRYDQATEVASLSGGVLFNFEDYALSCAALELDGRQGRGSIPGQLSGYQAGRGLYFQAGQASLSFPADVAQREESLSMQDFSVSLSGGVRAADRMHNTLLTDSLSLDGAAGQISTGAEFELLVSAIREDKAAYGKSAPAGKPGDWSSVELYPMLLRGSQLRAGLDRDEGLTDLQIDQPLLRSQQWLLSADSARLYLPALSGKPSAEAGKAEAARLSGSPVKLILTQGPQRRVFLQADSIALFSRGKDALSWQLEGGALLDAPEGRLNAASLNVSSTAESYSVEFPDGLDLDFNLSLLGASSVLEGAGGD